MLLKIIVFHPCIILLQLVKLSMVTFPQTSIARAQENPFELPVQLIGFPVIILAVRMSNFVKKLAYSLSPSTYRRSVRAVKGVATEPSLDLSQAEKELISQLGPGLCVYEDVCMKHVKTAGTQTAKDWENILREFYRRPKSNQEYYLLSVFLGDIIRSPKLCQHFTKIGRQCT